MTSRDTARVAQEKLASLGDDAVVISLVADEALMALILSADAAGATAALAGHAFVVKDNIDVAGCRTTAGCPSYGHVATQSATVVERLVAAGAVPVAKTNLDQFATGLVGTRSPYGTPQNPYDPSLVPGGSSSGSAVAVAAGAVSFALGTDTAGSGRVPAALCGIVGYKPTRGWLSNSGVVPAVRSMDCVSVFAPTVDLAWAVAVAAGGYDAGDPMSRRAPVTPRATARRAGVMSAEDLERCGVIPEIVAGYADACAALADLGVELHDIDIEPFLTMGRLLYGGPTVAERYAAVGEFVASDPPGLDPTVREIILEATVWSAVDAYRNDYELRSAQRYVDETFATVDVLVTPTVPRWPTIAEVCAAPRATNTSLGTFTTFTNLADLCAIAVPLGEPCAGGTRPPMSVSLHAPAWCDEMLVATAKRLAGSDGPATLPREWLTLAVAGAHLKGQPLEWQLVDRGGIWLGTTTTSATYQLHALAATEPPKPGLVRAANGTSIEVDLWGLSPTAFGDFVQQVPAPLCIGSVELADGRSTSGFLCEPRALEGAVDITHLGGWRRYVAEHRAQQQQVQR